MEYEWFRVPTLWEAVEAAGGTTASVAWPTTVGAPIRWNVPEVWSPDLAESRVEVVRRFAAPPGFLDSLEAAVGPVTVRDAEGIPLNWDAASWDDRVGAMAEHILETRRPTLTTVHFVAVDSWQHRVGIRGDRVRRALGTVDRALGRLVEAMDRAGILDRTAFVVTGDHGFVDVHTRIAPNVLLREAGLLAEDEWSARFQAAEGGALLHLAATADSGATVESVRAALEKPSDRVRSLYRIVDGEELRRLGADPRAVLGLTARPGAAFLDDGAGALLRAGSGGTHGHHPDLEAARTVLVCWGSGVEKGEVRREGSLVDVSPVVAELLGMSFPGDDTARGPTPGKFR